MENLFLGFFVCLFEVEVLVELFLLCCLRMFFIRVLC